MLHLPFLTGVALGAGVIYLLTNKRAKEKMDEAKEYVCEKFEEGKESVSVIKERIKEKKEEEKK
jgi:hypothetical protein